MNERIKELRMKVDMDMHLHNLEDIKAMEGCFGQEGGNKIVNEYIEKFAELIVRECVEQVWYTREDGINGNISQVVKDRIKEHFGVEELPACKHDWYSAKNPVVQNGSVCVICGAIDAREPEELKNERTFN
jgi:hypothetical protein